MTRPSAVQFAMRISFALILLASTLAVPHNGGANHGRLPSNSPSAPSNPSEIDTANAETRFSLPTHAFEMNWPSGQQMRVSTSEVNRSQQQQMAEWVIQNQEARSRSGEAVPGFSIILYKQDGELSDFLRGQQQRLNDLGVFPIEVPKALAEAQPLGTVDGKAQTHNQTLGQRQVQTDTESSTTISGANVPSGWSLDSMKKAGLLVSVGLVSISGSVYFATHEVGHAAMAATLSFTFHLIANKFAQQQLRFFNAGGAALEKIASKVTELSPAGRSLANEMGRWVNGYLYNIFGTALFAAALGSAPLPVDLATAAKFSSFVGTSALFYLFSDNSWDMGFARLMKEAEAKEDTRRIKTLLFMKYTKSTVLTMFGPLMFVPELRIVSMVGLSVAGTIGLIASRYPMPFVNLADKALGRLENSRVLNGAAATFQRWREPIQLGAISCRRIFAQ